MFLAYSSRTCFWDKIRSMQGTKKAKQRFMIALIANGAGRKEYTISLWKLQKPRFLKVSMCISCQ